MSLYMQYVGEYSGRQVFWLDFKSSQAELPDKEWVCLAIANKQPDIDSVEKFARTTTKKNIFEFKGYGTFGE
ncbi:MAG: hypothetical protein QM731_06430 [Chitinophagaceae bacterium]